jgi:hypothetical protein
VTPHLDLSGALQLIDPRPEQWDACAATITQRIKLLRDAHHFLEEIPSPGHLKKELKAIGRDLKRTRAALQKYSAISKAMIFEKDEAKQKAFLGDLDWLIVSAQFYHDALVVRHGRRPWDNIKAVTAKFAFELLTTFGAKEPTKTAARDGGVFLRLAALLYKGITGKNADLGRYCGDALDHAGDGRIEPNIVVRVPFEH